MNHAAVSVLRQRIEASASRRASRAPLSHSISDLITTQTRVLAVTAVAILASVAPASATTYTWDSNGTNGIAPTGGAGVWDTGNHFTSNNGTTYVPWTNAATDDVLFNGTGGAVNVAQPVTNFLGLKFDVNNYVLGGSGLTSTVTATFNVKTGMTATINNVISGTNISIGNTAGYGGTLILGGASNYTGTTTFGTAATVKLGIDNALPTTTSLESGTTGTKLDLNGFNQTLLQLASSNQSQSFVTNTSATTSTLTITTNSTITASGQTLTGNLNVTKTGTGAWLPAINHTFTGVLTLAGGATTISNNANLGAVGQATWTLDGSGANTPELNLNTEAYRAAAVFDRAITLVSAGAGTGARIGSSGVKAVTLSGVISGSGNLRFGTSGVNQGALILAGNNTYSGSTTLERSEALIAAHDNAFGNSPMISQTGSNAGTVGFQRSLTNQNINVGATTDITFINSAQSTGLASVHNFSGDNSFGGDISMVSGNQVYGAESGSSLLLKGAISGTGRSFAKSYGGTIALSGANTYTGATIVNRGTLLLDFSQSGAPVTNIVNNVSNSSALTFTGGTLEVKGRDSGTASQVFNGLNLNAGAATISTSNSASGVTVSFGSVTRQSGTTANFILPTAGSLEIASGTANSILANSSGVAYATVGGNDWAARGANGTSVVGLSLVNGYTPTTATTLAGNANVAAGVDTTVGTTSNSSTRFDVAEARTITLTGDLTTGGILVTSVVGNNVTTITGGNLKGPSSNQDLVVIQNNNANLLRIESTIINNATASGLVKGGSGTLELTGTNTYSGPTTVVGGVLKLTPAALGLPGGIGVAGGTSNLVLNGGVLGLTSDFSRGVGTGVTQVRFTGDGGFAAYDADRTVTLGATTWASGNFIPQGYALLLSANDATHTVVLALGSNIDLNPVSTPQLREIRVANGGATVDARINGNVTGNAGILKTGNGTLELAGANTYTGMTQIDGGTLLLTGTLVSGSSETTAFTVNNGSTLQIGNSSASGHVFIVNSGAVNFTGAFSYTSKGLTLGGGASGTTSTVDTAAGTMNITGDGVTYNGQFNDDNGATISGNLSLGTATRTFNVGNSAVAAKDLTISAVVSHTSGTVGLTKTGNGTLDLAGANTYNGVTTASAGTLLVSGSIAGAATVSSSATLGGAGTIAGTVAINSGGTLAPGASIGTLSTGALSLNSGSTFALEIGASASDSVNVTGAVTLTGNITLTIALTEDPTDLMSYTILNGSSALVNTGGIARFVYQGNVLDEGEIFTVNDNSFAQGFSITYAGDSGRDVVLVAVPEPGACASLFLGLGSLAGLQRFRRRKR